LLANQNEHAEIRRLPYSAVEAGYHALPVADHVIRRVCHLTWLKQQKVKLKA
jgi:hypothetical protein